MLVEVPIIAAWRRTRTLARVETTIVQIDGACNSVGSIIWVEEDDVDERERVKGDA